MSVYTMEKITTECKRVAREYGYSFNIPIVINGRMRSTLGRVDYVECGKRVSPTELHISRRHMELDTDAQVEDTILHEMAHWLAAVSTGESHGHDKVWKEWCARIGARAEVYYNAEEYGELASHEERDARYSIYCSKCNKLIATRTRASKITKNPNCYQSKCCKTHIIVKQNF